MHEKYFVPWLRYGENNGHGLKKIEGTGKKRSKTWGRR
jgi:hypothetical protein